MIVITIEMWPRGDKKHKRLLGRGVIVNTGGDMRVGEYSAVLEKSPEYASAANVGKAWKKCAVTGFPRLRLGPWDLVFRALRIMVGSRNP